MVVAVFSMPRTTGVWTIAAVDTGPTSRMTAFAVAAVAAVVMLSVYVLNFVVDHLGIVMKVTVVVVHAESSLIG